LLDYTRREEIRRRDVDFDEFLTETVRQFRREHDHIVQAMELMIPQRQGDPAPGNMVPIDPVLFRQVLFNLFCNASEACGGKGEIKITHRKLPRQTALTLYADRLLLGIDETVFEITVTDSGPGVAPEALDSLFAPFFTTRQGGHGLGLAMAWKVMKAHGGDIALDRAHEGGARFVILIPIRIGSAEIVLP
jgi:two-component system NtrC family sensor kinase